MDGAGAARSGADRRLLALAGIFFVSGSCGLAYQVVWARLLTLIFGSTVHATATVLGVFMLGLALGSHVSGRWLAQRPNPGRIYALIEIALGLFAVAFPLLLDLVQQLHSLLFPLVHEQPLALSATRLLLAVLILIVPTTLMGATLPVLSRLFAPDPSAPARGVGLLYSLNTFGAAAGAFFSAYAAIPLLGLDLTIYASAALNVAVGGAALALFRNDPAPAAPEPPREAAPARAAMLWAVFVAGFSGMLLENAWSHALVLVFGTSVYAFATMLTTFLVGIGLGSLAASRLAGRIGGRAGLVPLFALMGLSVYATTAVIGRLPGWFVSVFSDAGATWTGIVATEFAVSFLVMFAPTFLSGVCFPLVVAAIADGRAIGRAVARAYTVNTVGCILGALLAGFAAIPLMGAERTLLAAGALCLLLAAALALRQGGAGKAAAAVLALCAAAGPLVLTTWDPMAMNSGVYVYSRALAQGGDPLANMARNYTLLFHDEGAATVAVLESAKGHRFLRINGKTDGSDEGDNYTQMFLGYLPTLYARNLDDALVIGLGTGITSDCLLDLPLKRVTTVEISPEVVAAAPYFSKLNSQVFADPRSTVRTLDGRTWLMAMPETYDIIVSEPSNPWQTGNANLFTVDFFRLAAARLKPGGVLCQWLPIYHMDTDHVRLIIKSLRAVFPHVNVWLAYSDALIICSNDPLEMTGERLENFLSTPAVARKLDSLDIGSTNDLLSFFYLDEKAATAFGGNVPGYNLDSRPVIEFDSPKYVLGASNADTFMAIVAASAGNTLPLRSDHDPEAVRIGRILKRQKYYQSWGIPPPLADLLLRQALSR